jgi:beta-galactosidase
MIETPLRRRIDISEGWDFVRGRVSRRWIAGSARRGEIVDLPHCWNRGDTFQYGRRSYSGKGAYRRTIDFSEVPRGAGHWHLHSEGFYGFGDLWLDGREIARFDAQYLGFDKALTNSVATGAQVMAVRLDNLFQHNVLPGRRDADFLLYGGLSGRMWLEWVPELRIEENTIEIVCESGPERTEIIEFRCEVRGLNRSLGDPRVRWIVTDASGERNAAAGPVPVSDSSMTISTIIPDPKCWSPVNPHLYWAEAQLETDNGIVDSVRVRFGITRAEFRPDEGFFLDGRRVDLRGCNRHESIPGLGNALPVQLHRADAQLLKDYGCNFVRLSHYPQHPAFLDACDELGITIYAEIATWKSVSSSRGWRRAARRQMRELILRDRHHPSVILWGMGNESRSRTAYLELREIAHELDPARPVTYAENHLHRARRERTFGIPEVWSLNYELERLEEAKDACGSRNVIVSECCNYPSSVRGDDGAELTQVATLEYEWKMMAGRPYVAGYAVWSFTDYATEYRKRFRRLSGLFDAWRRPKMAAELFRARYAADPFISLFLAGDDTARKLHIFTNCRELRLARDDTPPVLLGDAIHHNVPLTEAFDCITVSGKRNGHTIREELVMWGAATTVAIEPADAPRPGITIPVDLTAVDRNSNPVLDWNGTLQVDATGDARIYSFTDSGEVEVARGKGRAYLALGVQGEVLVSASAEGLATATASMKIASSRSFEHLD